MCRWATLAVSVVLGCGGDRVIADREAALRASRDRERTTDDLDLLMAP